MRPAEDKDAMFWDMVSWFYDDIADKQVGRYLRAGMLKYLSTEEGLGNTLELGCGTGYFTEALAKASAHVTATDFSDGMLGRARDRLKDVKNLTIMKEDCRRTSFPFSTFDTVFMGSLLNTVDDPVQVLREVRRILKPGGWLIVTNPDWSMMSGFNRGRSTLRFLRLYGEAFYTYPHAFRYLSKKDLTDLLVMAGFQVATMRTMDNNLDPRNCALEYVKAYMLVENVVKVEHLVKRYGSFCALRDVSLSVRRGDIFALVGPNGAGKSTLVDILEGRKSYTGGSVSVLGLGELMADKARRAYAADKNYGLARERIGILPQKFRAFDFLTVYENIDYFAKMYASRLSVDGLISGFGLGEKRDALFKDLSVGLKKRVGIAIAMANDPDIVFLDEPTTGLDPAARRGVWAAIKTLKARGKTVFLATHYMDEAYQLADYVCIMHKGRIVAGGSPEEVVRKYGGDNTLIIRECSAGALDRLAGGIPESRVEGNSVLARVPEGDGMASIEKAISILGSDNRACKEIYIKRPTLDDVFINLTGERLTAEGQQDVAHDADRYGYQV